MNKKDAKKLISIYRKCVDTLKFEVSTNHYSNILKSRINSLHKDYEIPKRTTIA